MHYMSPDFFVKVASARVDVMQHGSVVEPGKLVYVGMPPKRDLMSRRVIPEQRRAAWEKHGMRVCSD
jgi:hypothetical protein